MKKLLVSCLAVLLLMPTTIGSSIGTHSAHAEETSSTKLNAFTLIEDNYLTGTFTGDIAKVRLVVNGKNFTLINVTDGVIKYYAKDKILTTSDDVKLLAYSSSGQLLNTTIVTVKEAVIPTGSITPDSYLFGTDTRVTGTYSGDITRIALQVNGVVKQSIAVTDGIFSYYAKDKILAETDAVKILAYSSTGKLLDSQDVTVKTPVQLQGSIAPNTYFFNTDSRVTGTYSGDVVRVGLQVNGVLKQTIPVTNNSFSYFAKDKIIATSDEAQIIAYDKTGSILDRQPISIRLPFSVNTFNDNTPILSGTGVTNATIKIYINDSLAQTTETKQDGTFSYAIDYIDYNNKIKVEQWVNNQLREEKEFIVSKSGDVDYTLDSVLFWQQAKNGYKEKDTRYFGQVKPRYRNLITNLRLRISTGFGIYVDRTMAPDATGNFETTILPMYGATSLDQGPELTLDITTKDARKLYTMSYHIRTGIDHNIPVINSLYMMNQGNSKFSFSGNATTGSLIYAGVGYTASSLWAATPNIIPVTANFAEFGNFTTNQASGSLLFHRTANLPIYAYAVNPKSRAQSDIKLLIQNENINLPPSYINSSMMGQDLTILGIPNSKVKINMKAADYIGWGNPTDAEFTVQLNQYGVVSDYTTDSAGWLIQQYGNISVTNIVGGITGKTNILPIIQSEDQYDQIQYYAWKYGD
ncbi:immunoglobulin-like domain-containing protein [Listeria booriae]|uniref:Bacterial Ig domain-containing protein n=1 Tax=Listeria booriae TaxID=1552123 RepID=A0A7X0YKY7_9LIST|nr:immunoglobulin-like domain-containing protein [Listeria booriae]MBC2116337.1 hypothetical protein [Listeria booriae]